MHCPTCGAETATATTASPQCSGCGARLPHWCRSCGFANPDSANYCSSCGQPLPASAVAECPAGYSRAPAHLVERVLSSRAALEGERKQVTVLFADIRGSFDLIEGGDPEEAQTLFDTVLAAPIDAVHRYEGTVNQLLGDGLMALFGAPVAHEDHAVRAACAALAMQRAVGRLSDPSWEGRGAAPQLRVGLNSGDVVIRTVRNDLSMEYRAVGSTTHMAARMEQLAAPGAVWLTAETVRLGRGRLRTRSLGPMQVKGVNEPIEVFELTGITARTRFQATEARGLSPLSGRSEALSVLAGALASAFTGQSRAVALCGDPGVGKSRLCYELLHSQPAESFRVLEACAVSYGRTTPHGVLASMLRSFCGIDDDDGPELIADKARASLPELGAGADQRSLLVLDLLDVRTGDREWQRLDPVQRRRRIEETLRELLSVFCARGPTVLLFEDLHWCDAESLAFIAGLVQTPLAPFTLLLLTHRPELAPSWLAAPHLIDCRLESLAREGCETLLEALVGGGELLAPLRRLLAERTGGNPFFLEESAHSLVEWGVLRGKPGAYALDGDPEQLEVPATVEALIAARLDRFSADALAVLQAAAVIDDESPIELLRQVAGVEQSELETQLATLTQAELLYDTGQLRSAVYRFKHALIQEVVYRRQLRVRRRVLHARVVETIEKLYAARLAEHVERLAEHCYRAELWDKCVAYRQLACTRAAGRWANAQAIAHLDRGLEALGRLPRNPDRDRAAVDLRLTALAPLVPTGDHARMIALLREAEGYARELADPRRQAAISSQLAMGLWMTGQHERAMEAAEQATALAAQLDTDGFALEKAARYNTAMIHHARGELLVALGMLRELIAVFSGTLARQRLGWSGYPSVFTRTFAVSTLSLLGGFEEAGRLFAEGRALADELDHPHSRTMILEEGGFCLLVKGEHEAARSLLEQALHVCERDEVRVMYAPTVARLGVALLECGAVERGRALLEDAMARETHRAAGHYAFGYLLLGLSEAQLRMGELEPALAAAQKAVQVAIDSGEHAHHVCALVQLGNVLRALEADREALAAHEQALEKAQRLGMRPWIAFAQQGRAALLHAGGRQHEAQAALAAAEQHWTELGAPARVAQVSSLRNTLS